MKKWEYRVENISAKNFTNEHTLREIKEFLSHLGSDGWELIEIIPTHQFEKGTLTGKNLTTKGCLFIFKRELM